MASKTKTNLPELFSSFKQGDQNAFSQIFNHFYQSLCYFGERITGDDMSTEDIVQDIFVRLWQKYADFETIESLKSFLFVSVRNACFNYLERNAVKLKHQEHLSFQGEIQEITVLQAMIRAEVLRQVFDAVDTLPEQCRRVIKMTFEEGKKPKEIAEELGVTVSTVNNQKMRGISLLKDRLPGDELTIALSILVPAVAAYTK
ncbi:RNA polymerase sigma-70 factor [Pedobacter sp. MC2016-14]|uniref:RNA polymerase sigma-70 factor n=1 Tax=Pedobacter sp. MC2016-14 TaxID=2897327 RepID=UPI001E2B3588|nr:RNA polymerase sigma-70 factor [Pedobacter sp. MC2016-14]MCD0490426.1 RNA polymerase sigma-70 factor [Pedobacter sp. MC2016-14]